MESQRGTGKGFAFDAVRGSCDGAIGEQAGEVVEIGGEVCRRLRLLSGGTEFQTQKRDFAFMGFAQQRQ